MYSKGKNEGIMSECGHERIEAMYDNDLKMRIGSTWSSMMRCQDGDDFDATTTPRSNGMDPAKHGYIKLLDKYICNKNAKILELGAGDGGETRMLIDWGYKNITGITVGRKNCSRGKEIYGVDLEFMDMHFTTFPNKSFDAIIGFHVYEHTPAPLLLGLELNRLLVPGGKILLQVPYGQAHFPDDDNPHHLNVVPSWITERMLRKAGFSSIIVERTGADDAVSTDTFFGIKVGNGCHNNHFNDIVNGKFIN